MGFLPELSWRLLAVWARDKDVYMKTWSTNFLTPIIEPLLYVFAFGTAFSIMNVQVDGLPYLVYFAPAIVAIAVMNRAFFENTFSSFFRMYYQRTYDAIVATPVNLDEVVAGEILWGATKGFVDALLMTLVIAILGLVLLPAGLLIVPLAFLGGLAFASMAMFFTSLVPSMDGFSFPLFLVLVPMFLLSNTFFPAAVLGPTFALIAELFPLTHVVALMRGAALGTLGWINLLDLTYLMVFTAAFFIATIHLMRRRLIK
jgi:lipooligosaccharide transport system permease protein